MLGQTYDRNAFILSSLKETVFATNFTEFEEEDGYREYGTPNKQYVRI